MLFRADPWKFLLVLLTVFFILFQAYAASPGTTGPGDVLGVGSIVGWLIWSNELGFRADPWRFLFSVLSV